jgi:hypothetical protein
MNRFLPFFRVKCYLYSRSCLRNRTTEHDVKYVPRYDVCVCVCVRDFCIFNINLTIWFAYFLFPASLHVSFDVLPSVAGDVLCGLQFTFQRVCNRFYTGKLTYGIVIHCGPSQWLCGVRCGSAVVRLLGLRVRIPPESWVSAYCECCLLSEFSALGWSLVREVLPSGVCLRLIVKPR